MISAETVPEIIIPILLMRYMNNLCITELDVWQELWCAD